MLEITADPIGVGRERSCYIHPDDPRKAIKIPHGRNNEQTRRELRFYRKLKKRNLPPERHVPRYYGQHDTNLGRGIIIDLIRDYDGQVSRALNWYLANGYEIEMFEPCLIELKQWFLENLIIFNHDLTIGNLLVQKSAFNSAKLIAIDGLGDVVAIDWLDYFPPLVRRKIERRWARFIERLYRTREVRAQREGDDQTSLSFRPPAGDK